MAQKIEWSESLAFGLEQIDVHHEQVLRRFRIFELAVDSGKEREAVAELFEFLQAFTQEHFEEEEAFLEYIGYPELEDHKRLHSHYVRELDTLVGIHAETGTSDALLAAIQAKLVNSLIAHITVEDKKCAGFASRSGK